jgi:Helix-turn-helix domain
MSMHTQSSVMAAGAGFRPPGQNSATAPVRLPWLTTEAAAEEIGISPRTLERKRADGSGPRYAKAGHAVRYRRDWIDDWLEKNSFSSTSAAKAAVAAV